jgi:hypothetical protein
VQAAALNRISPDAENGHLLENIPTPWAKAKPEERHAILSGFLECVYADLKEPASVVESSPSRSSWDFKIYGHWLRPKCVVGKQKLRA